MQEVQEVQKEEGDEVAVEEDEDAEAGGEKDDEDGVGQARVLHFRVCSLAHPVLGEHFSLSQMFFKHMMASYRF